MKMMIPANLKPWLMPALLGLAVLAVTGCQGPGYQKSDSVALNAQTAAVHVHGVLRDLDLATNTLHELVNQPATDAKPQFLRFSQALDRLSHSSKNSSERVKALGRNRTPYFEVWDKELLAIKDEEVRKRSQARRDEVRTQFDATIRQSLEAHDTVQPVVAFLSDVRTALSTDLTQKGLVAMQPLLSRAAELTGQAQGKLGKLATDLDSLSARMASYRVLEGKEVK